MRNLSNLTSLFCSLFISLPASAQILIEDPGASPSAPSIQSEKRSVGRPAATDYFKQRDKKAIDMPARSLGSEGSDRVLMLHIGKFFNDKAYRWGEVNRLEDVGQGMLGVTYRIGEWKNSMDLYIRAELMSYDIDGKDPLKLSIMPIIAFPDARSEFPLYFGAGIGAGVFFKQAGNESDLSLDYALLIGTRFPELFESGGLFFETGLKGQVHLLSSGQQDGVFLAAGAIFSF